MSGSLKMHDVPECAGANCDGLAHGVSLIVPGVREPVPGLLAPVSIELLQRTSSAWISEFRRRTAVGIVDRDGELWTNGFLRDYCAAKCHPPGQIVTVGGESQGIVLFDSTLRCSRSVKAGWLLYVRYLATAPWNRSAGNRTARYRRVGHALLIEAVRESIRMGTPGRVGLHVPEALAPFFEAMSFECLGADLSNHNMMYLELRPSAAFGLLTIGETPYSKGVDDALEQSSPGSDRP